MLLLGYMTLASQSVSVYLNYSVVFNVVIWIVSAGVHFLITFPGFITKFYTYYWRFGPFVTVWAFRELWELNGDWDYGYDLNDEQLKENESEFCFALAVEFRNFLAFTVASLLLIELVSHNGLTPKEYALALQ